MKIHKKILTHYLSCTSPVDKQGYLYKKRERNASYQRRWFVLKGNLLFYQERPADRRLLGVIVLEGCAVQHSESDGQLAFSLVFRGPGLKTYRLAAEDREGQESWVKALLSASHCYLSLLVRDLGKQYEATMFVPSCRQVEAKRETDPGGSLQRAAKSGPGSTDLNQSMATLSSGSSFLIQGPGPMVRGGRSFSASQVSQGPKMPAKAANKKSPKLWPKRNAHVTPLNGPAPAFGEWPMIGLDSLEEFSTLHDYYGQEVMQLREDWLRRRQEERGHLEEDVFGLG